LTLLLLLLWGFFALKIGDLKGRLPPQQESSGELADVEEQDRSAGLIITFVWAYADDARVWRALAGAAIYLLLAYVFMNFQSSLQLHYASYITIIACCVMLGYAVDAGLTNDRSEKHLATRGNIVWAWIAIQMAFILFGLFSKKMLPCMNLGPC
jgi:hypothetical protein